MGGREESVLVVDFSDAGFPRRFQLAPERPGGAEILL